MRKNLLVLLVLTMLLSMVFISCGGEDGEDPVANDDCTTNQVKCDGTKSMFCSNGAWVMAKDCAATNETCQESNGEALCVGGSDEDDDDTANTPKCGNGVVEGTEVCDGGSVACETLGNYNPGTSAQCLATCAGYDTSVCVAVSEGGAYGSVNASGNFGFIFDYSKLPQSNTDSAGQKYMQDHMNGIIQTPVFTGKFGSKTIDAQIALAVHLAAEGQSPATVLIMQQSQTLAVQVAFPSDNIQATGYSVDPTQQGSAQVYLIDLNSGCIHALAWGGTLNVTAATNTAAAEGGSIAISATGIQIYHPSETPMGDISAQLGGTPACPKN